MVMKSIHNLSTMVVNHTDLSLLLNNKITIVNRTPFNDHIWIIFSEVYHEFVIL